MVAIGLEVSTDLLEIQLKRFKPFNSSLDLPRRSAVCILQLAAMIIADHNGHFDLLDEHPTGSSNGDVESPPCTKQCIQYTSYPSTLCRTPVLRTQACLHKHQK